MAGSESREGLVPGAHHCLCPCWTHGGSGAPPGWQLAGAELGGGWNGRLEDPGAPARQAPSGWPACLLACTGLVTGALFSVSQGSWVRSSPHLQPRMIG